MPREHGDMVMSLMEEGLASYSCCSSSTCLCRICHEEEEQNLTSMESPCACSGTLKFAHRRCIQRWCDEKGSTLCEICLQEFGPGYSVPSKNPLVDVGLTIRGSLVVLSPENEEEVVEIEYTEWFETSTRRVVYFRSAVVAFTTLLLLRHLICVIALGSKHQPLTLFRMFALRASGILLPIYLILKMVSAVHYLQILCRQSEQIRPVSRRTFRV